MPPYASIFPLQLPLSRLPVRVGVYRYQPTDFPSFQLLPNIRVLSIQFREGPDPGLARFRYVFDSANPTTDPTSFEQALSVDCNLTNVVQNDERLVVFKYNSDGTTDPIFDGFAQVPELSLAPSQELVSFVAFGVSVRAWDTPIGGALMRNSDDPTKVSDVETDLVTYFNPAGRPNATPVGADATNDLGNTYPTFLDPLVVRSPDLRKYWTLCMSVRYLCYQLNADETYIKNPDGACIDSLLDSRSPNAGVQVNPADPTQFQSQPILVPDYPATGKPWPLALYELLEPNGFGMAFRLETDDSGSPVTRLDLFRRQDASSNSYKELYLQLPGDFLDPARTNLAEAKLARDTSRVANIYSVESRPARYEASFVLAPGFPISPSDASDANTLKQFDRADPSFAQVNRDKYRLYVFDETGEGHWDFNSTSMKANATSLVALLGSDGANSFPVVKRRRVPSGVLFTTDSNRKPLKARLSVSNNYTGLTPGLWDGSGTWQNIVGGFELLQDRLGIWVQVSNPNGWNIGLSTLPGMPYPTGIIKGIEDQANTTATHFTLRLTCVIEADNTVKATADQRPSSSTSFGVTRRVNGTNRYAKHVISANSEFNITNNVVLVRDDTAEALAEAEARRLAGEAGEVAGSVTVPRITTAYRIGDRIRAIRGRDLSLRTNAGAPVDEGEVFPAVVGLSWEFESKQQTTLLLSDHRGDKS